MANLSIEKERRTARVLDGSRIAVEIKREVAETVVRLNSVYGVTPHLAVVRIGDDQASEVYVRNKVRTSEEVGIKSEHFALPATITIDELLELITSLNKREEVDGILVQLPLPGGTEASRVLEAIDPAKDVDGFHPINVGRLAQGQPALVPCTPAGIIELLIREGVEIQGARACVVGRSHIVGRPMAALLLQRNATVTICHSHTRDFPSVTSQADILIAAIGRPALIRAQHIKPGAIVVDVGVNKVTDEAAARALFTGAEVERRVETIRRRGYTLIGDVHPAEASEVAGALTPVPGGVGPLTVAMLMRNTVDAYRRRRGLEEGKWQK
ncbi:MAG TPA: bifunctional methylenetetrahydrofolate dehydrogenase/methenyltetrahydrofolate cyclohydrolase FolD [Pyrinomonadaceae bacterium]|nr:bifunctional methylenetetrahydrofolate dehydrogenase/methenyltetrahydrofolate cyclohydrolase FolD [Pyrinomonadaceae bacterium]